MSGKAKHGQTIGSPSREYRAWTRMKNRCYNQNYHQFSDYGGRGIFVCPEWRSSFEQFYKDMGECPDGYTLERKDNDGGYSATNCKWATRKEQGRNKRNNNLVTFNGKTQPLSAWGGGSGIIKRYFTVPPISLWLVG